MTRAAIALATALLTIGFAASNDAKAEVAGPVLTQRAAAKQLPAEVRQARASIDNIRGFIVGIQELSSTPVSTTEPGR